MKKILLCPPTYYDIEYEINPWMDINRKANKEKVWKEYESLKAKYTELGLEFMEIEAEPGLPDMVYAANFGFAEGKKFIKATFKFPERRKESDFAEEYLKKLGYEILTIPEEIYFEGQGDLLKTSDKYFYGWGKRSVPEAKVYLEQYLDKPVIDFELINPYYYHLDTCFAPLSDDTVLINQRSFTPDSLKKVYEHFPNVIETSEEDNKVLCCNLVVWNKNIVVAKGITIALIEKLDSIGFKVHQIDTTEYLKGGGSVKCLSLELFD